MGRCGLLAARISADTKGPAVARPCRRRLEMPLRAHVPPRHRLRDVLTAAACAVLARFDERVRSGLELLRQHVEARVGEPDVQAGGLRVIGGPAPRSVRGVDVAEMVGCSETNSPKPWITRWYSA